MKKAPPRIRETLQLDFDAAMFKAFLRDLLFREAGKPYFKRLAVPRRRRLPGTWRTLSTYRAERQLLPVGGRDIDRLIREFFMTHACLRAEFQQDGMPVTAIHVLRQRCPACNPALEHVAILECALDGEKPYGVHLVGGPAPPSQPGVTEVERE